MKSLRRWARERVKSITRRFGFDVVRVQPHQAEPEFHTHPIEALYSGKPFSAAPLNVDLWKCSNYTGLTYGREGWHPFVEGLKADSRRGSYAGSALEAYYADWVPADASEAFIILSDVPEVFQGEPSYAFVSPWHTISIKERKGKIAYNVRSENRDMGHDDTGIEGGFGLHGPVSETKGKVEYERLLQTFQSIDRDGYRLHSLHDFIEGFALVSESGEDFRIVVVHGNHRLASLTALEFDTAPIRLVPPYIVRSCDVARWPQVESGLWDERQAIAYFDSFFEAHDRIRQWAQSRGLIDTI
jgi:hypothetical protein